MAKIKYTVRSTVMIDTVVEVDDDEENKFDAAGDLAGNEIYAMLRAADVDFDFCDEWQVYDEEGNEVLEAAE